MLICFFLIYMYISADKTVVWTANRDSPVNGNGSRIVFQKYGSLHLVDYDGTAVWSTNTAAMHADGAVLLDTGQPCHHGSRRPSPLEELRLADRHTSGIAVDGHRYQVGICICQEFAVR